MPGCKYREQAECLGQRNYAETAEKNKPFRYEEQL